MTSLVQRSRAPRPRVRALPSTDNQWWGVPLTNVRPNEEGVSSSFLELARNAYAGNSVVFACELTRLALFSEARFQYRRIRRGRPGDLFGLDTLRVLEQPWQGGRTGDLLVKMLADADLAGTSFTVRPMERRGDPDRDRLMRLRPDWCTIVLGSEQEPADAGIAADAEFLGVMYYPGGSGTGRNPIPYLADETAMWAPIPDPTATFRGMSWLVPVRNEVNADQATTEHKLAFFRNGATPQVIVTMGPGVNSRNLHQFVQKMEAQHTGSRNAYKTFYLGHGASAEVVGADLRQLDFKATQGAGETRIAAASGVHPVVAALSEGLSGSSLNAGNFNAARRIVADRTLRPLWRGACSALSTIIDVPTDAELWYDGRDISFLQEDRTDAAEIQRVKAETIRQLVEAGFEPTSVIKAVEAEDMTLLDHTGRLSVQLQDPRAADPAPGGNNPPTSGNNGSNNGGGTAKTNGAPVPALVGG